MPAKTFPFLICRDCSCSALRRASHSRNLRPLENKGFVETLVDEDQRIRLIKITKRGEAAAALGAWKRAQSSVGEVLNRSGVREGLVAGGP
ncbi:MAG TPA: hypothetical protein VGY91_03395 [Chthoniobacterales bacterium]|jgi:hypothetical protein|nr:hypothetical protein [Chthoniobacterales bacterium]